MILVNETLARTAWPGQSALGKCMQVRFGGPPEGDAGPVQPCRQIVGIVRPGYFIGDEVLRPAQVAVAGLQTS